MIFYGLIIIGLSILVVEALIYWRSKLISSHRALARAFIIDYKGLTFWASIEKFNGYGDWGTQFWKWHKWSFEDFYPSVRPESPCFLGV